MAIDFTLTSAQQKLQRNAREFAVEILQPLVKAGGRGARHAEGLPDPQGRLCRVPQARLRHGLPAEASMAAAASATSICRSSPRRSPRSIPGFATVLLVNGLALMPLAWFGSEEQKRKWLGEATSDPRGEYLAGWTVSEAAGTPGGTANFDHPGALSRPASASSPGTTRGAANTCSTARSTGRAMPAAGI